MLKPSSQSRSSDKRCSEALIALVHLLARQAAREALAKANPPADAPQDPLPEIAE